MTGIDMTPMVVDIKEVPIPIKAVFRRLGYPPGSNQVNGEVGRIFNKEVERAHDFLKPQGVYCLFEIQSRKEQLMTFCNSSFILKSSQVVRLLRNSELVCLFMVTIGSALEQEVQSLMDSGDLTQAVILDAIGSETADAAADKLHRDLLKSLAETEGFSITARFSPGYGDWPLTVQKDILCICNGKKIGISVNDSFLMNPRKSVSALLGWEKIK